MRCRKRQLLSEGCFSEPAAVSTRACQKRCCRTRLVLGCHPPVSAGLHSAPVSFSSDPLEFRTSLTQYEERCERRLFPCLPSGQGTRKGSADLVSGRWRKPQQFRGPSSKPFSCCRL